jgi:hypothetical protein
VSREASPAGRWQELHGSGSWKGLLDPLDADCTSAHPSRPTASSRRLPSTYGFNSDDESSPDAGSCPYSHAGPLAASGVCPPTRSTTPSPSSSTRRATRNIWGSRPSCTSRSISEVLFVQQKEDQSQRQTNWNGYVAVSTDGRGRRRTHSAGATSSWRGVAPSRYIVEYLKDVDFE